jgi:drug/metabolite transporter (DMT)-like permease
MVAQVMSLVGALLVLGGYFALQRGWLAGEDRLFNLLNLVGAGLLTWVAIEDRRVGFIILEGAWALLSLPGVTRGRWLRSERRTTPPD